MRRHSARSVVKDCKRAFFCMVTISLLLCSTLRAQEVCTAEIKLLMSPPAIDAVISAMSFGKKETGKVYFFDTDSLALLAQGVIVRVRQGAKNDLTVKVRLPKGDQRADSSTLREHFECEIDRTAIDASTSYSVGQKYKDRQVPETGAEIFKALDPSQQRLLEAAHVSIDWSHVRRIARIASTTWQTKTQPEFPNLALESWEWPAGNILELSARVPPNESESKLEELKQMVKAKGLSLSPLQGTKTSLVLKTVIAASPHK